MVQQPAFLSHRAPLPCISGSGLGHRAMMRRIGRSFVAGGLLAVVAGLALTAPASAQAPTLADVEITGDPVVGSTLTAVIAGTVDPSSVAYSWCHQGDRPGKCAKGPAVGSGPAYVPVA